MELFDYLLLSLLLFASLFYLYKPKTYISKNEALKKKEKAPPKENVLEFSPTGPLFNKVQKQKSQLVGFYGSQTGTAESLSSRFIKEAIQYGLSGFSMDLIDFEMEELNDLLALKKNEKFLCCFFLATYGDGEPTDNAHDFYDWLMSSDRDEEHGQLLEEGKEGLLSNMNYFIFGLGNKTYDKFNYMARQCDSRLRKLGAKRLGTLGEGDDDGNMEEDFVQWKERNWPLLCAYFEMDKQPKDKIIVRSFSFKELSGDELESRKIFNGEHGQVGSWESKQNRVSFDQKNPYYAKIKTWHQLYHKDSGRTCLHIELDLTGSPLRYQAGDHVGIFPKNQKSEVLGLARALNIEDQLDHVFEMRNYDPTSPKKFPFPSPTTYRAALSYYLDIATLPSTQLLSLLSMAAQNPEEKERLNELGQGHALYRSYIIEPQRCLREVLEDFKSIKFSLQEDSEEIQKSLEDKMPFVKGRKFLLSDLFEMLPRLQPRFYSISSSPKRHPQSVHVTCSVVEYQTSTGRQVKGVTTGWLQDICNIYYSKPEEGPLVKEALVPIFLRPSTFRLPRNALTPIIMIGPGTGLAPFRGFIQERSEVFITKRKELQQKNKTVEQWSVETIKDFPGHLQYQRRLLESSPDAVASDKVTGAGLLFFGCRNRQHDFLYHNELLQHLDFEQGGGLSHLFSAFSRETSDKVYVQNQLEENGKLVVDLLKQKQAYLYICGDAKNMAKDVNRVITQLLTQHEKMSQSEAFMFISSLKQKGRWLEDVWS